MIHFCTKITKRYYFALTMFMKVRDYSDGIDFVEFETSLDLYEMEHNPKFVIRLMLINFTIFELEFYRDGFSSPM